MSDDTVTEPYKERLDSIPTAQDEVVDSRAPPGQHTQRIEYDISANKPAPQKTSSRLETTRSRLGLHPTAPIDEEHDRAEHSELLWSNIKIALREPFAEFFGVFIMVLFGDGSVAQVQFILERTWPGTDGRQVLLSAGEPSAPGKNGFGDYQSISWGWGLGVMLGIYVAGDSGGQSHGVLCRRVVLTG